MWDNMIHDIYSAMLPYTKLPCDAEVRCKICGTPLKTYYAEGRLYLVKCGYCDTITMVQAGSPFKAAAMVGEVVELMRLIDADKLEIRKLAEFNDEYGDAVPVYGVAAEDVDNAPAVDAIVLPVKTGQTVYWIINNTEACRDCKHFSSFYGMDAMCDKGNDIVMNPWVSDEPLCDKQFYEIIEYKPDIDWIFSHRERLGKTVFLTREAAEEALKARENNAN